MSKSTQAELVTVKDLSKRTGASVFQINDYIDRGFLKVVQYAKGRSRLLADPPCSQIVAAIRQHVEKNGSLRTCLAGLEASFPNYYE